MKGDDSRTNDIALICGNHTNAHTIVRNLGAVGFLGKTVLLRVSSDPVLVADRLNPQVEKWIVSEADAMQLPEVVKNRWGGAAKIFVFFTNERFHHLFASWKIQHPDDNIVVQFGNPERISTIIDRYELYQFIESRKLGSVPKTISGTEDPVAVFGDAFVVRPRESWQSPTHREEVKIVRNRAEYKQLMQAFDSRGVGRNELCFQELLSVENESSVAIGGWFDRGAQHLFCLRKRFQHPPGVGSGDVCERIDPPEGVMESAVAILSALNYCGPLELEFVFDENSGEYKVIEMNPRFWMQHGLPEVLSGYALVRRYLGNTPLVLGVSLSQKKYWVNTVQCLYRILFGDFRPLFYYFRKDSWAPYTLSQAVWYAPLHVVSKLLLKKRIISPRTVA